MKRSFLTLAGLLALVPTGAQACSVCMGAAENVGEAMNGAIFLMLGCIGSMLALITSAGIVIVRRSHHDEE